MASPGEHEAHHYPPTNAEWVIRIAAKPHAMQEDVHEEQEDSLFWRQALKEDAAYHHQGVVGF
jgi:hypothetical protein